MDFNDGNWRYRGALSILQPGKTYHLPWSFLSKNVAIDAIFRDVKPHWYRAGYIRFESNGLQAPNGEPLSFGRSILTSPNFPEGQSYKITFTSVRWVGFGRLRCWEFVPTRKLVRPEPINPDEFTTREIELLMASGLDPAKLRLSPESLEVVLPLLTSLRSPQGGSILTEIKDLIQDLQTMANTDIRSMLAAVEAATMQGNTNAATIATQGVTLADVKATAVVEKNFTLQKDAFILEGDVYRAPIQHDMGSKFPGVTIYDNGGDLQLAEFIAIDPNQCKLELTAVQWADNDFPLTVNLQARSIASVVAAAWKLIPTGAQYWRLQDGILERSADGVTVELANWQTGVSEAFMTAIDREVFVKTSTGTYGVWVSDNPSGLVPTTQEDYEQNKSMAGTVIL